MHSYNIMNRSIPVTIRIKGLDEIKTHIKIIPTPTLLDLEKFIHMNSLNFYHTEHLSIYDFHGIYRHGQTSPYVNEIIRTERAWTALLPVLYQDPTPHLVMAGTTDIGTKQPRRKSLQLHVTVRHDKAGSTTTTTHQPLTVWMLWGETLREFLEAVDGVAARWLAANRSESICLGHIGVSFFADGRGKALRDECAYKELWELSPSTGGISLHAEYQMLPRDSHHSQNELGGAESRSEKRR